MNFTLYKQQISALLFGKRLNNALYLHLESLLSNNKLSVFVEEIRERVEVSPEYSVIKFILSEFRISFLEYPDFFKEPHPQLKSSITINLATGKIRNYNYSKSDNPPILHRKETLLEPNHPLIPKFKALTEAEECEGLYENPRIIGFKENWEHLLGEKGLSYEGHKLIKISTPLKKSKKPLKEIERHKTAITRYNFSQPIKTIFEYDLVNEDTTIFDYGCGQGDDIKGLNRKKNCPLTVGYEKQKTLEESCRFINSFKFAILCVMDIPEENDRKHCKTLWYDYIELERYFDSSYNSAYAFRLPMTCPFCLPKNCRLPKGECVYPAFYRQVTETYNINVPKTFDNIFGGKGTRSEYSIILVK